MKKFLLLSLLFILSPVLARGATCDAGQYLNNNTCTDCPRGYYCNGDTIYKCPDVDMSTIPNDWVVNDEIYLSSWRTANSLPGAYMTDCRVSCNDIHIGNGTCYYISSWNGTNYWNNCDTWSHADTGYYLSGFVRYISSNQDAIYSYVKPCENTPPANAHFTESTPPDNPQCQWVCDDGYYGLSENGDTSCTLCPAGYACTNGVMTNCANITGADGRATYSGDGASSCTECPAVTGEFASRSTGNYQYWTANGVHTTINGCHLYFYDDDDDGTYLTHCYYTGGETNYGGSVSTCQSETPTECRAGYYNAIPFDPDRNGSRYIQCKGIDCAKGRVCRPIEPGYYLVPGNVNRYNCTNAPTNSSYTGPGTANNCPWVCDDGFVEYMGACHAPCSVGVGVFHAGEYSYPLFGDKTNVPSPVIHVRRDENTVCYVYMEQSTGNEHGLHVMYGNTPYHAIDPRI